MKGRSWCGGKEAILLDTSCYRNQDELHPCMSPGLNSGELKHATFLSHGRQPEVNISHARTVLFPRFSN